MWRIFTYNLLISDIIILIVVFYKALILLILLFLFFEYLLYKFYLISLKNIAFFTIKTHIPYIKLELLYLKMIIWNFKDFKYFKNFFIKKNIRNRHKLEYRSWVLQFHGLCHWKNMKRNYCSTQINPSKERKVEQFFIIIKVAISNVI